MEKMIIQKVRTAFHISPSFISEIDHTMKKIQKGKDCSDDEIPGIIDSLINHISEFGSYWKRTVNPLNIIYKRAEFINYIIKANLEDCAIEWTFKDPSLNISNRKKNIIRKILEAYLHNCGLN